MPWSRRALAPLALFLLVGCQGSTAPPAPLSDGDIAAILAAENDGELRQGQLAQSRASAPSVLAFANRLVDEHTAAAQRQAQLFQQPGLAPTGNALSQALAARNRAILQALQISDGFDLDYLEAQITVHSTLLTLIDGRLLVDVHAPQLRDELQASRSEAQGHLDDALQLKSALYPDAGSGQSSGPN